MSISKCLLENENLMTVKDEVSEILNLTNSLSENQQRELLAFARGYKCGTIAPKESA
ncbi:MAG: hypothetical protein Q4D26_11500 [Clostridia bacterium]|nr:hypothetical protein [Clostridia bacterium]